MIFLSGGVTFGRVCQVFPPVFKEPLMVSCVSGFDVEVSLVSTHRKEWDWGVQRVKVDEVHTDLEVYLGKWFLSVSRFNVRRGFLIEVGPLTLALGCPDIGH